MDIFSKNKLLVRLVFFLVMLNLFSVGFLWFNRKGGPQERPPKENKEKASGILKERLRLTPEQEQEFRRIREDFTRREENLGNQIKSQRDSLNEEMFNEIADSLVLKTLARNIAENEYRMELYRIEQAQQLKAICTREQLREFQNLIKEIRDYFQPQKKNPEKPRQK